MTEVFDKIKINTLELSNRFIMAAADDNLEKNLMARQARFSLLAQGNIGLIISGGLTLEKIPNWKKIIQEVHEKNGKIALQIVNSNGGRFKNDHEMAVSQLTPDNPFFQPLMPYRSHHEATEKEILQMIQTYALAAQKAQEIGADAIEIHSAHQSILLQFLSPLTNKRKDQWGGSIENRTRVHRKIIEAIREKAGKNFPVIIKVGMEDAIEGGLLFPEGKKIALLIAQYGYDAIEVSQGLMNMEDWEKTPMKRKVHKQQQEAYYQMWSQEIKSHVSIPVILTGGILSYEVVEKIIKNNTADLIGLCRPLIREPLLIERWRKGHKERATCISCNQCISELLIKGLPLECYLDKKK